MNEVLKANKKWIDETWRKIDKKLSMLAVKSRDKIPYTTKDGIHDNRVEVEPDWWTNGFWGGMMWLMYSATGNEEYKKTAVRSEELLDEAFKNFKILHHDVGFMWHILSGANARLTGDEKAYNKTLYVASMLASRFNSDAKFISAWNDEPTWSIIDTMMNLPLLYWASREIENPRFKEMAMHHADMVMRDHIRADGSVNHIVIHDMKTGEGRAADYTQGYSKDSCWSRGMAWTIYGMVLSYTHTGKKDYLDAAKKAANYFITQSIQYDYKTPIDFIAPVSPMYYDTTASTCTACGLLEIAKFVSESESSAYIYAAVRILKEIDKNFADYTDMEDALVLMGSERYPNKTTKGLHIPIIYGDFYYVEAMLKLKGNDFLIW